MDLISLSPLPVASLRWINRYGRPVLTFVCRATFALAPGESRLAEEQETPSESDNHWDDDPSRSLYAPSDLVPLKARAEVMLVGSAFAPRGEAVRSLRTRLVVGEIDKSIDVYGERAWGQDGVLREGPRFAKMPLRWERAAGGPSTSNPVGASAEVADAYGQIAAPNLLPPGVELAGPRDFLQPVGYGPLAMSWPDRREKLRMPVAALLGSAWTQQPLPEEVDPHFFNAAPRDQQVEALRENERLVLENLHPEHARLVTSLPGIRPRAFAEIGGAPPRELAMVCDTLWINTDSGLCTLTWRGQLALDGADGRIFVALEEPGQRLGWDDIERLRRNQSGGTAPRSAPASAPLPAPRGAQTMDVRALQQALQGLDATPSWLASPSSRAPGSAPGAASPGIPRPQQAPPSAGASRPPQPSQPALEPPAPAPLRTPPPLPEAMRPPPAAPPAVVPPPALFSAAAPAMSLGASLAPLAPLARSVGDAGRSPASNSALDASNAAAQREERAAPRPEASRRIEAPVAAPRQMPGEYVDLIWFDPAALQRARAVPQLRPLFAVEKKGADAWLDETASSPATPDQRERASALRTLTRGRSLDDGGITQAMADAVTDEGAFTAPIAVITGELHFRFDELETLKATVVALTPLTSADKKLKELCDAATELLRSTWASSGAGVAEAMTGRLREAFAQQSRSLPASYLERTVDRTLLEQRRYQKRAVLGGEMIRALLFAGGSATPVPAYLPESISSQLPLFPSFKASVLASVTATQDQSEPHAAALHVIALGRVLPMPGRGSAAPVR